MFAGGGAEDAEIMDLVAGADVDDEMVVPIQVLAENLFSNPDAPYSIDDIETETLYEVVSFMCGAGLLTESKLEILKDRGVDVTTEIPSEEDYGVTYYTMLLATVILNDAPDCCEDTSCSKKGNCNELEERDSKIADQIQLLLNANADPSHKLNQLALAEAASQNFSSTVQVLIDAGFDVNVRLSSRDEEGKIQEGQGPSALQLAAECGNMTLLKMLLKAGADVNAVMDNGRDPKINALAMSCETGELEALELLLENKAETNVSGINLFDNLMAYFGGKFEETKTEVTETAVAVARILIAAGEKPDSVSAEESTPLAIACEVGNLEMVKVLVEEAKAEINISEAQINRSKTLVELKSPICAAASENHMDIVQYLTEQKAAIDKDFCSPISYAAQRNFLDMVSFLLDQGWSIEFRDTEQVTPLGDACMFGQAEAVSFLLEKGANIDAVGKDGLNMLWKHIYDYDNAAEPSVDDEDGKELSDVEPENLKCNGDFGKCTSDVLLAKKPEWAQSKNAEGQTFEQTGEPTGRTGCLHCYDAVLAKC